MARKGKSAAGADKAPPGAEPSNPAATSNQPDATAAAARRREQWGWTLMAVAVCIVSCQLVKDQIIAAKTREARSAYLAAAGFVIVLVFGLLRDFVWRAPAPPPATTPSQ